MESFSDNLGIKSVYLDIGFNGILVKKGHFFKNWKSRQFILDMKEKTFKYYSDTLMEELKGVYVITPSTELKRIDHSIDGRENLFLLTSTKITGTKKSTVQLLLSASSSKEREKWLSVLNETINNGYRIIRNPVLSFHAFHPYVDLQIIYDDILNDHSILEFDQIKNFPVVSWNKHEAIGDSLATLLLIDLDISTSKISSENTQSILWSVVNISNCNISSGVEVSFHLSIYSFLIFWFINR